MTLRLVTAEADRQPEPAPTTRALLGALRPGPALEVSDRAILRTPRLVLRPLQETDRAPFIELVRGSRVHLDRWSALHRAGESDDDLFDRQLELTRSGERRASAARRAVCLHDGTLIGACNLTTISRGLQFQSDCNWWVGSAFAGRGLATEALASLVAHALADLPSGLGLHRIFAGIRPDNLPSIAVARKCGFARQAQVKSYLNVAGAWELHDMYVRDVLDADAA